LSDAIDNFFSLSDILRADVLQSFDCETEAQSWRRGFIRASASLIEGYAHGLRELCAVSFRCTGVPMINSKEQKVIRAEKRFNTVLRVKYTLSAAYKLFELMPAPHFGRAEWQCAKYFFTKRDKLMHPKRPEDLEVADGSLG
jgi:hypothetical protein